MSAQTIPTTQSTDQLLAEIARLRAQNEALAKAKPQGRISVKLTEKGGLSVYGLGRFPVTLYREQWERLIQALPMIQAELPKLPTKQENRGEVTPAPAPVQGKF